MRGMLSFLDDDGIWWNEKTRFIIVSRSRAFHPRPAAWVERVGDTTSGTICLTLRRVVAVAC